MAGDDRYEFLHRVVHSIPGWLLDFTAIRTMDFLRFQEAEKIPGALLEIGVFEGRYYSLLLDSAIRARSRVVGIDTFQYAPQERVESTLYGHFGDGLMRSHFVAGPSSDLDPARLIAVLGEPARFVSIDGSHDKPDVYLDLVLCDAVLGNEGVIAVDDFLNPVALGVNEAVNLFFQAPRRVVPFAYTPNKLWLSRPAQAERYKAVLEEATQADDQDPIAANYRANPMRQALFGCSINVVT